MNKALAIAADEWRYWQRSNLVVVASVLFFMLLFAISFVTYSRLTSAHATRSHLQHKAHDSFLSQPDRHPHRMVHYGHYVFRTPSPLAVFDPGVDFITGQAIFLEGHRQNTAMFSDYSSSAFLGSFSWLNPALLYQLLGPLLIIILGYSSIARERENGALRLLLAQGLHWWHLLFGKLIALLFAMALIMLPLIVVGFITFFLGERGPAVLYLCSAYLVYLIIWVLGALLASSQFENQASALALLISAWLVLTLIAPAFAASIVAQKKPVASKIEYDLAMLKEKRKLGDGHDANDPAFAALRKSLLKKYQVDQIAALPVNIRGVIAAFSENQLSSLMNRYAQNRRQNEVIQTDYVAQFGWISPSIALAFISRAVAGTDLYHHHRFLKEAEALRYEFVQSLNKIHAKKLAYTDDINRYSDAASEKKARVDARHWSILSDFDFKVSAWEDRRDKASLFYPMLITWFFILVLGLLIAMMKIKPWAG